jgi:hypothetical protein
MKRRKKKEAWTVLGVKGGAVGKPMKNEKLNKWVLKNREFNCQDVRFTSVEGILPRVLLIFTQWSMLPS